MKRVVFFMLYTFIVLTGYTQEIIIQENEIGFCTVDGDILTSVAGYTGDGYADTERGVGKSISWNVEASQAGTYAVTWQYANGGGSGARPARILINGTVFIERFDFQHTNVWTNWTESDTAYLDFIAGNNKIRLEAHNSDGLGNYDYMKVIGEGVTPAVCLPSYTLTVSSNNEAWGSVSWEPVQAYYDEGTIVTVRANANSGYFFQSWTGEVPSSDSVFTFPILQNISAIARFLPDGTEQVPDVAGYATIQDDSGTPYLLTGGALGDTVQAFTFDDLETYLESDEPKVVTLANKIEGTGILNIHSHKTLLGTSDNAHLKGIEVEINGVRNVIVQNVKISHVTPQDALEINGASQNVWLDHCELFSDRDHGTEFYDGLLDIKNESRFITISWNKFHDHFKTSLISSGDQAVADTVIRVTYHHNYFYNCESRLPSIRFGTAHIFNNYYKDCSTAINSRMGACVRVEKNYFNNVGTAVMMAYSPQKGSVELIENHFGDSRYSDTPSCVLNVPYIYEHLLDEPEDIPILIAGEEVPVEIENHLTKSFETLTNFPNPFNPITEIRFQISEVSPVQVTVYDLLGREVDVLLNKGKMQAGDHHVTWNAEGYAGGIYFVRLLTNQKVLTCKIVLLK